MKLYPRDLRKIAEALEQLDEMGSVVISEFMVDPTITVAVTKRHAEDQRDTSEYYVTQIRQVGV
jgi:hypothetical protein